MKVVLLAKVDGLGNPDEIKDVAEGYANNFLFPHHLAVLATPKAIKQLSDVKQKKTNDVEKELEQTQKFIDRVDGQMIVIREKANEHGILYAAITAQKIVDELTKYKYNNITKNQIITPVIKELGEYPAKIKFKHGLEAKITLSIRPVKK